MHWKSGVSGVSFFLLLFLSGKKRNCQEGQSSSQDSLSPQMSGEAKPEQKRSKRSKRSRQSPNSFQAPSGEARLNTTQLPVEARDDPFLGREAAGVGDQIYIGLLLEEVCLVWRTHTWVVPKYPGWRKHFGPVCPTI